MQRGSALAAVHGCADPQPGAAGHDDGEDRGDGGQFPAGPAAERPGAAGLRGSPPGGAGVVPLRRGGLGVQGRRAPRGLPQHRGPAPEPHRPHLLLDQRPEPAGDHRELAGAELGDRARRALREDDPERHRGFRGGGSEVQPGAVPPACGVGALRGRGAEAPGVALRALEGRGRGEVRGDRDPFQGRRRERFHQEFRGRSAKRFPC
mmetsp:Transcript_39575/g.95034  ORF Transcript_39575/g.95034 Transcript_39575/m.95034 type:complete len:206 (+) Transcript_39575:3422-4039(+)